MTQSSNLDESEKLKVKSELRIVNCEMLKK